MKSVLPPTLLSMAIVLMIILQVIFPICFIIRFPFNLSGLVLIITGSVISIWGSQKFSREKTSIMTFDEPSVLVISGLYKYSRNPMYLGFVLFIFGVWAMLGSLAAFIVALIFSVVLDSYYIRFEEKVLGEKFGKVYFEYKKKVRRWI